MRIIALALSVCLWTAFGQQRPQTRAEEIEQARQARKANLQPDVPPKTDRFLLWLDQDKVLERITLGYEGFRARFGQHVSGSGVAFGAEYFRQDLRDNSMNFAVSAQTSTKNYQRYEGDWGMPTLMDSRLFVATRGLYFNYPSVNFYGPGPNSSKHGRSDYRLKNSGADVLFGVRPLRGLSFGVAPGFARISAGPGTDSRFVSTDVIYTPAQAPGINTTTDFARYGVFGEYDWRDKPDGPKSGGRYFAQYARYNDISQNVFDFGRTEIDLEQYIGLLNRRRVLVLHGNTILTSPERRENVPFYLQPSVGGAETLRGFRSFRFTDRNALVLNGEYRWEAFTGLDVAAFVDAGKVFPKSSQLNFHDLESSVGFGLRFNARNRVFLRIDVGFSHEGYQVWFKFGDVFMVRRLGMARSEPED